MNGVVYDYSKLRGRIVEKYGSQGNFSRALGISQVALSRKLNNIVDFRQDEILKSISLLDIPNTDLGAYFFVF